MDGEAEGRDAARQVGLRLASGESVPEAGTITVPEVLRAMRADSVPAGRRGLWTVAKSVLTPELSRRTQEVAAGGLRQVPPGNYTHLFRDTMATIHKDHGECVMNDFPGELRKHLEFVLRADGHVLVTGLGLACVVRGLLAVGKAERIVVVERDRAVIDMVWPSLPADDRLELAHADATEFVLKDRRAWDYAWHDLWTDRDAGEQALHVLHAQLMVLLRFRARRQGAWAFPREFMRSFEEQGIDGIGRDER